MRLALRFLFLTLMGIFVVLAGHAGFAFRREVAAYDQDARQDHEVLAHAMAPAFAEAWEHDGQRAALHVLSRVNAREGLVKLKFVPQGSKSAPSPSARRTSNGLVQIERDTENGSELATYVPVEGRGARGYIEIRESTRPRERYVRASLLGTTLTGLGIFAWTAAIIIGLGVLLIAQPIRALVEQARRIGSGEFSTSVSIRRSDELGELTAEMNRAAALLEDKRVELEREARERVQALNQLRHADRLATVGKLASGIAHELGTPLNVVSGRAKMIRISDDVPEEGRRNARIVEQQVERMTRIIRQLLDFARAGDSHLQRIDLSEVIRRVISLLTPLAEKRGVALVLEESGLDSRIEGDPGQLEQVLTNLVVNAVQAMTRAGTVALSLERERVTPPESEKVGEYLSLHVRDEGAGMSPQVSARVFEPFFTTKGVGEGTGLGLSVAYGIVREHGGFMLVESTPGLGSRFSVYLPVPQPGASSPPVASGLIRSWSSTTTRACASS